MNPRTFVGAVFIGALVFVLAFVAALLIRRTARQMGRHLTDVTALQFVSSLAQFLTYLFGFVLYAHLIPELRALGTALLAGVSVISVVAGVAAQSTLGNLVAGFALVMSRTVHAGETVGLQTPMGAVTGKVQRISLGYTVLLDQEGREVVVPNSVIMGSAITRMEKAPEA